MSKAIKDTCVYHVGTRTGMFDATPPVLSTMSETEKPSTPLQLAKDAQKDTPLAISPSPVPIAAADRVSAPKSNGGQTAKLIAPKTPASDERASASALRPQQREVRHAPNVTKVSGADYSSANRRLLETPLLLTESEAMDICRLSMHEFFHVWNLQKQPMSGSTCCLRSHGLFADKDTLSSRCKRVIGRLAYTSTPPTEGSLPTIAQSSPSTLATVADELTECLWRERRNIPAKYCPAVDTPDKDGEVDVVLATSVEEKLSRLTVIPVDALFRRYSGKLPPRCVSPDDMKIELTRHGITPFWWMTDGHTPILVVLEPVFSAKANALFPPAPVARAAKHDTVMKVFT